MNRLLLSGLSFAVACSGPGSAPDASVDSSVDAALDGALDAQACGSCDDGDPATRDACVEGRCEHRTCDADAECDDGDFDTTDRCVLDLGTATWVCGHANADGNCERDADCFDLEPCTRDMCGTGGRCRHSWSPGCAASAPTLRPCPATAREGGACAFDSAMGVVYDCRETGDACADWLHCVGGTFDAHYVRVEVVRPGCDSGSCPTDIPSGICSPDQYCDYSSDPEREPPGRIYCDCWDRSNPRIEWECADNDPCPRTPPADGAPIDRTPLTVRTECHYGDYVCDMDVRSWTWACEARLPRFCPSVAPLTGDACTLPSECRYYGRETGADPVTTYRGDCSCDGTLWTCGPNEAAECPEVQPRPGTALDLCRPSVGNRHCWYPGTDGPWTRCHCDGAVGVETLWTCEMTARY